MVLLSNHNMGSSRSAMHQAVDTRKTSDTFGEISFFSEAASPQSAWTNNVVRVLMISKVDGTQAVLELRSWLKVGSKHSKCV